jgi:tetratricopeptide (TPR) repeat protein
MKRIMTLLVFFTLFSHALRAQSPDIYYALGVTLLKDTNYTEAISCFNKVIEHNDRDIGALTLRGYAKMKKGHYHEAMDDFNKVIRIDPMVPSAWNHRGLCKKELKNYRGALSDFSWAVELDPQNKEAFYNRGVLKYFHLHNPKGGCKDWEKAAALGHVPSETMQKKYCNTKTGKITTRK